MRANNHTVFTVVLVPESTLKTPTPITYPTMNTPVPIANHTAFGEFLTNALTTTNAHNPSRDKLSASVIETMTGLKGG